MITASLVTYKNNPEVLRQTINSYLNATNNSRLFVIDNSPTDAAGSLCTNPNIEYIFNNKNVGFGKGHNLALKHTLQKAKYHLVLNPDVYFEPTVIDALVSYMEQNSTVGLVMPKVLYPDGRLQPLCKLIPTPHQLFVRRFLPAFKGTAANTEYEMRFIDYNSITEAPFLSGCFMFLRTEALKTVGLFDERFFLYFEDTDLSRRIHAQFKTVYFPHVSIYHHHERSSHKELKPFLYSLQSAWRYFNKWGWFVDSERDNFNKRILLKHNVNGYRLQTT